MQTSKFYNRIINNIAQGVKRTLNEDVQNFEVGEYQDDSIVDSQTVDNILIPVKTSEELMVLVAERIEKNPECPYLLDINVSNITDFSFIFATYTTYSDDACNPELSKLFKYGVNYDILDIHTWDMSNAITMKYMFKNSNYRSIILPDTISPNIRYLQGLFLGCNHLSYIDLSAFNTSNVRNMSAMFTECVSLKELNLSHFNVEKVISMERMFGQCYSLKKVNMFKTNTPVLENITDMFIDCHALKIIDLTSITVNKLTEFHSITVRCDNLKHLKLSEELAKLLLGGTGVKVDII